MNGRRPTISRALEVTRRTSITRMRCSRAGRWCLPCSASPGAVIDGGADPSKARRRIHPILDPQQIGVKTADLRRALLEGCAGRGRNRSRSVTGCTEAAPIRTGARSQIVPWKYGSRAGATEDSFYESRRRRHGAWRPPRVWFYANVNPDVDPEMSRPGSGGLCCKAKDAESTGRESVGSLYGGGPPQELGSPAL